MVRLFNFALLMGTVVLFASAFCLSANAQTAVGEDVEWMAFEHNLKCVRRDSSSVIILDGKEALTVPWNRSNIERLNGKLLIHVLFEDPDRLETYQISEERKLELLDHLELNSTALFAGRSCSPARERRILFTSLYGAMVVDVHSRACSRVYFSRFGPVKIERFVDRVRVQQDDPFREPFNIDSMGIPHRVSGHLTYWNGKIAVIQHEDYVTQWNVDASTLNVFRGTVDFENARILSPVGYLQYHDSERLLCCDDHSIAVVDPTDLQVILGDFKMPKGRRLVQPIQYSKANDIYLLSYLVDSDEEDPGEDSQQYAIEVVAISRDGEFKKVQSPVFISIDGMTSIHDFHMEEIDNQTYLFSNRSSGDSKRFRFDSSSNQWQAAGEHNE